MQEQPSTLFSLVIDDATKRLLSVVAYWSKIFSITGAIFFLLVFARAVYTAVMISKIKLYAGQLWPMLIAYVLITIVPSVCLLFAYRFSSRLQRALLNDDQTDFHKSIHAIKAFFRYSALLLLVVTVIVGASWAWQYWLLKR